VHLTWTSIHPPSPNIVPPTLGSQLHPCRIPHFHNHHHTTVPPLVERHMISRRIPNCPFAKPRANRHHLMSLKLHRHHLTANLGPPSALLQPLHPHVLLRRLFLAPCPAARVATGRHLGVKASRDHGNTALVTPSRKKTRTDSGSDSRAPSATCSRKTPSMRVNSNVSRTATGRMNTSLRRSLAAILCNRSTTYRLSMRLWHLALTSCTKTPKTLANLSSLVYTPALRTRTHASLRDTTKSRDHHFRSPSAGPTHHSSPAMVSDPRE